jgi:hypothetical protein
MPFDLIHTIQNDQTALTFEDIAKTCPAAFTKTASPATSSRYGFVDTESAINILADYGFVPTRAIQKPSRTPAMAPYQEHMISFARPNEFGKEDQKNLVLFNSHNKRSSLRLMTGNFRAVCSNQLIKEGEGFDAKLRHSKVTAREFENLLIHQVQNLDSMMESIETMRGRNLSSNDCLDFAYDALKMRWDMVATPQELEGTENGIRATTWETMQQALKVRRLGDGANDCYTVFNRLQESVLRGGVQVYSKTKAKPIWTKRKARAITSLTENVRLNASLFDMAESFAA